MKTFFLEGYGCSLNISETEQINGFLQQNNFRNITNFCEADFVLINTCSVKMVTEQRMISRIKFLLASKKSSAKVIVVGCLAKTNHADLKKISSDLIVLDTKLESLTNFFGLKKTGFSPKIIEVKSHEHVSIIPISVGCVGNCAYCATKIARGKLCSYSIKNINASFKRALLSSKEIWITSQDLGCYGFDSNHFLPELIETLLQNKGDYRIRLGMMNPKHFSKIGKNLVELFDDDRLYKFLHLPVQSGSDKVLTLMNRSSSVNDFVNAVTFVRKRVPDIRIATDLIVGFPGETKKDFEESLELVRTIKPNVVNISRFGKRLNTIASTMPNQILESEKKERSKILTKTIRQVFLEENKKMLGFNGVGLVSEKASKNGFVARTNNYSPVLVNKGFGKFVDLSVTKTFSNFFEGKVNKIF